MLTPLIQRTCRPRVLSAARSVHSARTGRPIKPSSMWKPDFMGSLTRIEENMHGAITDLKALRTNERLWAQAFDSILAISRSTCKHLVGPQLVLLGHSATAESSEHSRHVETFAAGVELHHVFMLIHDDIADSGTIRRGVPTISVALADVAPFPHLSRTKLDQLATVIGDAVHARSMSLMFKGAVAAQAPDACEAVLKGAYRAGAAQFDDLAGWSGVESLFKNGNTSEQVLRRLMIEKRAYHGWISPLLAGLRLGLGPAAPSAAHMQIEAFCHAWAEHVGIASQALDDLADMILSPAETGKDSLQDLRDGRLSMPVFLLMQRASPTERSLLRDLLLRPDGAMILSDRRRVLDLIEKYNLREVCIQFAKTEVAAANQVLQEFQQSAPKTEGAAKLCEGLSFYGNAVSDLVVSLADNGTFNTREHRMGLWRTPNKEAYEICESTQHCVVP